MRYILKKLPLENLVVILSIGIIFILYNLYYTDQIDDQRTRKGEGVVQIKPFNLLITYSLAKP
jgi:hypothetical protein